MIFEFNDHTYRFSFKHEIFNGPTSKSIKMSGGALPVHTQESGAKKQLRGRTTCFINQLPPKDSVEKPNPILVSEGIARCSINDNYNKEEGRQLALRRALEAAFPNRHEAWGEAFKAYSGRKKK